MALGLALLAFMGKDLQEVSANRGAPKNCHECANLNGGDVKMCNWNGFFKDPTTKICCQRGKYSEYCVDEPYNSCSPYMTDNIA